MNSSLQNSDWNLRKYEKPLDYSDMTYIKSFKIIQWNDKYFQGITSDRVPEGLWMEVQEILQEAVIKTILKKKKCKKAKWLSEKALQITEKRR